MNKDVTMTDITSRGAPWVVWQKWRRMRDAILADVALDDAERQKRLLALDEKLCMLENAADEQVTHKNLDVYSQELVQTCLAKMCIDEQARRGERVRRGSVVWRFRV